MAGCGSHPPVNARLRWLTFALLAPSLAAGSAAPQTLDGLWRGLFDINGRGQYDFTALHVNGQVAAYSIASNVVYRGAVIGDERSYRSRMAMYIRDGRLFGTVQLDGTVTRQARSIVARFRTSAKETGTLGLTYDELFERHVALPMLAGRWKHTDEKLSLSLDVGPDGDLRGTSGVSCSYGGTVRKIRPGINAFDVQLEITSCGRSDGRYQGMLHAGDAHNTLHLSVTSDQLGMYYPLQRVETETGAASQSPAAL